MQVMVAISRDILTMDETYIDVVWLHVDDFDDVVGIDALDTLEELLLNCPVALS